MINEKIFLRYKHKTMRQETATNAVGPTTSQTLRTVTAHDDDNCKYVRKFGIAYEIKQVTDIEDPIDADMKFWVYALDGTLLGSRVGGGAFVAGTTLTTAQACYLKVTGTGTATMLTTVLIDTDVDAGGKDFVFPAESIINGTSINFYLSQTTSTYYDENLVYGGARHTPNGTAALPFFTITAALAALGGAFTIVTVLDSETYDEELTISGAYTLQAALGQTPSITRGIGARVTREVLHDGNNIDTAYVAKTGNDTTGTGTYQNPYLTIGKADTSIGGRTYINIMDDNSYIEDVDSANIEPIYGKTPTIQGKIITSGFISGININSIGKDYGIFSDTNSCKIYDNTIFTTESFNTETYTRYGAITAKGILDIKRNMIRGSLSGTLGTVGIQEVLGCSGNVENNIIMNCKTGFYLSLQFSGDAGNNSTVTKNNVIHTCMTGFFMTAPQIPSTYSGSFISNTVYNCQQHGISIAAGQLTFSGTIKNCIVYGNATDTSETYYDLYAAQAVTFTYMDYGTKNASVTANNSITTDPLFIDAASFNLAIKKGSGAYKTGDGEVDMGVSIGVIKIGASSCVINGFFIYAENYYYGIFKDGAADYSSMTVKYCEISSFLRSGIDDYAGTFTLGIFQNNIFHSNTYGLFLLFGAVTFANNIIYSNTLWGVYNNGILSQFYDNVFFNNLEYGYNIDDGASSHNITNSIFHQNGQYGIYSDVTVYLTNCCISDALSPLVDYNDIGSNNLQVNPMFVDEDNGDFRLKSVYNGSLIDSPLIGQADDGGDIGAYAITRTLTSDEWLHYQLLQNPRNITFEYTKKGYLDYIAGSGTVDNYARSQKRVYFFKWTEQQYTEDRKQIEYIQSLIKTRENGLSDEETRVRVSFLPSQKHYVGTAGVIDTTEKKLTDSSHSSWVRDEFKGFWTALKMVSTSLVIDASAKTATATGTTWTTNQWAGYVIPIGNNWFTILSNTGTVLTLSDDNGRLVNDTAIYSITKFFKVIRNTENVLYFKDDDDELTAGTYGYYVDFIECRCVISSMNRVQPRYYYQQENWRNGFEIILEEV